MSAPEQIYDRHEHVQLIVSCRKYVKRLGNALIYIAVAGGIFGGMAMVGTSGEPAAFVGGIFWAVLAGSAIWVMMKFLLLAISTASAMGAIESHLRAGRYHRPDEQENAVEPRNAA
jgi:hypothetical protein